VGILTEGDSWVVWGDSVWEGRGANGYDERLGGLWISVKLWISFFTVDVDGDFMRRKGLLGI
jgi:hypothetical protein